MIITTVCFVVAYLILSIYSILTSIKIIRLKGIIKKYLDEQNLREFNKFLLAETKMIEISKWIESEKAQKDLGETLEERNKFVMWWIENHAEKTRNSWKSSKCRTCNKGCYHNIKQKCDEHLEG